jgi:uncharacterized RDD family membrane protein YckC
VTYPPDPSNPYGQPPQQAPYGVPPQNPYGQQPPVYGYPQQQPPAPNYGYPQQQPAYGMPPQPSYGYAPMAPPVLAGWGARVGASFIDYLVVGLPATIGYITFIAMSASSTHQVCDAYDYCTNEPDTSKLGAGLLVMLIGWLVTLGLSLWQLAKEGSTGQTTGKKAVGIKVVREHTGQHLGFGLAFGRRLAHLLDNMLCGIGYLWPLWDDKSQTFADKVTNCLVIRA